MEKKIYKGSSWGNWEGLTSASYRGKNHPATRYRTKGFRLVRNAKEKKC